MEEQPQQQPTPQPEKPKKKFYKKWWFLILMILIIVPLFIWGVLTFWNSDYCHSETHLSLNSAPSIFSSDGKYAYFINNPHYYRPSTGICAFPDGEPGIDLHESIDLFELNMATHKMNRLATYDYTDEYVVSGGSGTISPTHSDEDTIMVTISVQDKDTLYANKMFLIADIKSKLFKEVIEKDYNNIISQNSMSEAIYNFDNSEGGRILLERDGDYYNGDYYYVMKYAERYGDIEPEIILQDTSWLPYIY